MDPQQPVQQTTPPQPVQQPNPQTPVEQSNVSQPQTTPPQPATIPGPKVPFYRSYWIFAAIYILLPPFIGLVILFSGDIFRKGQDNLQHPISSKEKTALTVLAFILWGLAVMSR